MAKIYVGIGHGGSDPGAVANGYKEKDLTLAIGKACYDELVRHGVQAKMSRTTDKYMSVNEKVKESDSFGADYCLDIHINAGGGDGCEVFYHHSGGKSKQLANNINEALKSIGQNSRGLKVKMNSKGNADYFGIIRDTKASAVLVECGFIDTKADLAQFDTSAEQKKFGIAIAHGILKQCGIEIKKEYTIKDVRAAALEVANGNSNKTIKDVRDMAVKVAGKTNTSSSTAATSAVTKTDFISRTYKNGASKEYVYSTTANSLSSKNPIGYLDPNQSATVHARYSACPVVVYTLAGGNKKVGFVKYEGGVTAQNYVKKPYKNGSTKEAVYSTTADCKAGKNSIGSLDKYEVCDCVGKVNGCYIVVYKVNGTSAYKVGFVKYEGGVK